MSKFNVVLNVFNGMGEIIELLKKNPKIGNLHNFDFNQKDSLLDVYKLITTDDSIKEYAFNQMNDDKILYKYLLEKIFQSFCYMMHRRTFDKSLSSYDLTNHFRILFLFFMRYINEHKINLVMAQASFSAGFDVLFYEICKSQNIKVLLFDNFKYCCLEKKTDLVLNFFG